MPRNPDAALEVALEQRRRGLEVARLELAGRERTVQAEAARLARLDGRVAAAQAHLAAAHVAAGQALDVAALCERDAFLQRCERDAADQSARLSAARSQAERARSQVVAAHQRVRSLELVLEARATARAERQRRAEARQTDEIATGRHARQRAAWARR